MRSSAARSSGEGAGDSDSGAAAQGWARSGKKGPSCRAFEGGGQTRAVMQYTEGEGMEVAARPDPSALKDPERVALGKLVASSVSASDSCVSKFQTASLVQRCRGRTRGGS